MAVAGPRSLQCSQVTAGAEGFAEVLGKIGDSGRLLIEVTPWGRCDSGSYPTARSLDADNKMEVLAHQLQSVVLVLSPTIEAWCGFAYATADDQFLKVFYRSTADQTWQLVFDEAKSKAHAIPLRFNRDGTAACFECAGANGVGGVCLWDVKTRELKPIWSGTESGPEKLLTTFDGRDVFAITSMPGRPALTLLDKNASETKLLVAMMRQFPGQDVDLGEHSADGTKTIFHVRSDTNPGEFYLYDSDARKASFLFTSRPWIKPEQMAMVEPIALKDRAEKTLDG